MSASVLARSYTDTPPARPPVLQLPSATGSRCSRPSSVNKPTAVTALPGAVVSSMKGERARQGGLPSSSTGARISFATDTSFHERNLKSRKATRSSATSLNLRMVQSTERPSKVRIRIPKATTATGVRKLSASHDEYLNPRKAVEIARSYGIPKYFLRSNQQQILTDGRMRLFGDSIWKKERTSLDLDRQSVDSSDVINRLMDSVNKAIETTHKKRRSLVTESDDASGMQLEVISLKSSGFDDVNNTNNNNNYNNENIINSNRSEAFSDKERVVNKDLSSSLEYLNSIPESTRPITQPEVLSHPENPATVSSSFDSKLNPNPNEMGDLHHSFRPHTVDAMGGSSLGYLPKVTFKETDMFMRSPATANTHTHTHTNSNSNPIASILPGMIPSSSGGGGSGGGGGGGGGLRLKQLAAPFKAVSDFTLISDKAKMLDDKYHNVLPRFYPAVSAHQCKQTKSEVDKINAQRNRKKSNQQRLVRFADAHTVRFSSDAEKKDGTDALAGVVVRRAPIQSIQRALDSHSCLGPIDKTRSRLGRETSHVNMGSNDVIDDNFHGGKVNNNINE